jgi:ATPase family associated with various cellular activities (AAA)
VPPDGAANRRPERAARGRSEGAGGRRPEGAAEWRPEPLLVGGPPGTGKTTAARALARRHGLRLYSADTRTWEHRDRAVAAGVAAARRFEELGPDADASDDELVAMSLHRERGPMVLADLRALPPAPLVIAEGSVVPAAGVRDPARAAWLLRSRAPRELRVYALVARVIEAEAAEHGVPVLEDPAGVGERFAGAIAAGPRARDRDERRALLREMNEAVADQIGGFFRRWWAKGDPEAVEQDLACECGDPDCLADVRAPVGVLRDGPVIATGHLIPPRGI